MEIYSMIIIMMMVMLNVLLGEQKKSIDEWLMFVSYCIIHLSVLYLNYTGKTIRIALQIRMFAITLSKYVEALHFLPTSHYFSANRENVLFFCTLCFDVLCLKTLGIYAADADVVCFIQFNLHFIQKSHNKFSEICMPFVHNY